MKRKLIITEAQFKRIKQRLINEYGNDFDNPELQGQEDFYDNMNRNSKEEKPVSITNVSRVTGGMSPTLRFTFSDGKVLQTKSNGYGVEYEDDKYVKLISQYFIHN